MKNIFIYFENQTKYKNNLNNYIRKLTHWGLKYGASVSIKILCRGILVTAERNPWVRCKFLNPIRFVKEKYMLGNASSHFDTSSASPVKQCLWILYSLGTISFKMLRQSSDASLQWIIIGFWNSIAIEICLRKTDFCRSREFRFLKK